MPADKPGAAPAAGDAKPKEAKPKEAAKPKEVPRPKERVRKAVLEKLQRAPRHKGEFSYRGYTLEQLRAMDLETLAEVLPSRARRKLTRGLSSGERRLLERAPGDGGAPAAGSPAVSAHPEEGRTSDAVGRPPSASGGDAPTGSAPQPPRASRGDAPVFKTHLRRMVVLPAMVGKEIQIHDGKAFQKVAILPEMIGHYLGELALTRRRVKHGAAGIGATRSSKFIPLK